MGDRFRSFLIIILIVVFIVPAISAIGESYEWDCPECGRIGNKGNYCGGCGHSAPWMIEETPTPEITAAPAQQAPAWMSDGPKAEYDTFRDNSRWPSEQYILTNSIVRQAKVKTDDGQEILLVSSSYAAPNSNWTRRWTIPEGVILDIGKEYIIEYTDTFGTKKEGLPGIITFSPKRAQTTTKGVDEATIEPALTTEPTQKPTITPTPIPAPIPTPMSQNLETPLLFEESIDQLAPLYESFIQSAEGWDMKTAPQKISDILFLPKNWTEILEQSQQVSFSFQHNGDEYIVKLKNPAQFSLIQDLDECMIYFLQKNDTYSDGFKFKKTGSYIYSCNTLALNSISKRYDISFTNTQLYGSWFDFLSFSYSNYGNYHIQMEYQLRDPEGNQINWCIYGKEFELKLYKPDGQGIALHMKLIYNIQTGKLNKITTY